MSLLIDQLSQALEDMKVLMMAGPSAFDSDEEFDEVIAAAYGASYALNEMAVARGDEGLADYAKRGTATTRATEALYDKAKGSCDKAN